MAIQCKYCGTDLPKEDARFCNNCGMLVPSHPFSHQSLSASKSSSNAPLSSSSDEPQERHRRVLREQVAELSPARAKPEYERQDEPVQIEPEPVAPEPANSLSPVEDVPAEKLPETPQPVIENDGVPVRVEEASEQLSPSLAPSRQAGMKRRMRGPAQSSVSTPWPAPVTHVSVKESSVPAPRPNGYDEMAPALAFTNNEAISGPENRAQEDEKAYEQADEEEIAIDDLPTRELTVPTEDAPAQAEDVPFEDMPTHIVSMPAVEDAPAQAEDVPFEDLPTRSIPVPAEKSPRVHEQRVEKVSSNPFLAVPATQSEAQKQTMEDWHVRAQSALSAPENSPVPAVFQPQASPHVASPDYQADRVVTPPPARRSRWPIIVVVLLIILILGGAGTLGAMMVLSQQSSNDPVIQAQVGFSDPQLGLSLLYPNGWQKQIDTGKSTAHFYASNHIGQVDIMVTTSSGTVKQALQQQATKMGMSGTKTGAALTFAGASWEQLQGTMQLSGASYTDAIIATVHGNQLYMIVQQGPQNNYADWDNEFFAPLRSSFKFL